MATSDLRGAGDTGSRYTRAPRVSSARSTAALRLARSGCPSGAEYLANSADPSVAIRAMPALRRKFLVPKWRPRTLNESKLGAT